LVLGGIITGVLIPVFTSSWEAREKSVERQRAAAEKAAEDRSATLERERAVETALVARIGAASGDFLAALEVGDIRPGSARGTAAYGAFQSAAFEIASQLAAYYPRSIPENRWRHYTFSLRSAYNLLRLPVGPRRTRYLNNVNRYFGLGPKNLDGLCFERSSRHYDPALLDLVLRFQHSQEEIVRAVIDSPSILTGTPTPGDPDPALKDFKPGQATCPPSSPSFRREPT
jgi:hypothetical protein